MRLDIPPIIPYAVGAMLVVFGALRVKYLGAPRSPRVAEDDTASSTETAPIRGKEQRRHIRMGGVWILLGLFLLVSTYVQTHRR